jgi:MFS family permease
VVDGVGLAGGSGGNLLGGAIIQFASWRWILLLNVPLAAAATSRSTMKQS